MIKLKDILLSENEEDSLNVDMVLPMDQQVILQAEDEDYDRGLLVTNNKDKSYDIAYWAGEFKPYPIEVIIDGVSVSTDAKNIKLMYHPEMK